jgi:hypothetical protein
MVVGRYIPGITLISQGEKEHVILGWNGPKPVKEEVWHEVYTPYPKVETRMLYWHDYLAQHEDWLGMIEPVEPEQSDPRLPKGFFSMAVHNGSTQTNFVCCSMQAIIYDRDSVKYERTTIDKRTGEEQFVLTGKIIMRGTPATKQIPTIGKRGADENALMKAETGAIGRALGLAGMLVVPGSGVASAEDIQEMAASTGSSTPQPTLMEANDTRPLEVQEAELRNQAAQLLRALPDDKRVEFQGWATQRRMGTLDTLDLPALKTIIRKLERG